MTLPHSRDFWLYIELSDLCPSAVDDFPTGQDHRMSTRQLFAPQYSAFDASLPGYESPLNLELTTQFACASRDGTVFGQYDTRWTKSIYARERDRA